jgi:hypothetical protein
MLTYANMNMTRLCCKIMQSKINVEQIKGSEGSYPLGTLFKEASKEASMCALNK